MILQAQNILQDQKIDELARFMNLTASRVRLHDKQIYNLQARMVRLEEGLKQLTDVTNFHIYASHQINVAQAAVSGYNWVWGQQKLMWIKFSNTCG